MKTTKQELPRKKAKPSTIAAKPKASKPSTEPMSDLEKGLAELYQIASTVQQRKQAAEAKITEVKNKCEKRKLPVLDLKRTIVIEHGHDLNQEYAMKCKF
jgi:hypothetical protein